MFCRTLFCILFLALSSFSLNAQGLLHDGATTEGIESEFKPGDLIIGSLLDSHEWHIVTIGERHIAIPLPILLIHGGKFHVFLSSRFQQGTQDYRGFRLIVEETKPNKIVHVNASGEISEKLPIDLSITRNVFSIFFVVILMVLVFVNVSKVYKKYGSNRAPSGFQNLIEPVILFIRDDVAGIAIPQKHINRFLPYLLTLFFFILFCNLLGLVPVFPGGSNVTGNIAVTMTLAIITFLVSNLSGKRLYFQEIFDHPAAPWWMKYPIPLLPLIEVMGLFIKPFVLTIRLFANIMAGHIIIVGLVCLIFIFGQLSTSLGYGVSVVSIAFVLFMGLLEILVSFIQAFIFTLLTAIYIGAAVHEPEELRTKS
jgi:F-type H+-transporting ATPase subunit a